MWWRWPSESPPAFPALSSRAGFGPCSGWSPGPWSRVPKGRSGAGGRTTPASTPCSRRATPSAIRRYALGLTLVLTIGIGSLAIGILGIGFDQGSDWRWVPIVVGGIVTLFALLTIPARLGAERWGPGGPGAAETPATVTIEGKRQTGVYINEQPRIEFDLLVEPEGLPAYRVTKKATVPSTALSDIGIGDGFEAKVRARRRRPDLDRLGRAARPRRCRSGGTTGTAR